jgi:hypothetical protein
LVYCKPVEFYNILYRRSLHNVNIFLYWFCDLIKIFYFHILIIA